MIRGIRGATTISSDEKENVITCTKELLLEMIKKNNVSPEDVCSVFISTTSDITSAFPAAALRTIEGYKYVPVMCFQEIEVSGALAQCIRVMMHVNTKRSQKEMEHVYLHKATVLRTDLVNKK